MAQQSIKKNAIGKILIIIGLIVLIGLVLFAKQTAADKQVQEEVASVATPSDETGTSIPRLVDLGAGQCIPCKMMEPLLEELKQDYQDVFSVQVIDVYENQEEARNYQIRVIPTQIFFDAQGRELFRHEGFYSKEDILSKWEELGVNIENTSHEKGDEE